MENLPAKVKVTNYMYFYGNVQGDRINAGVGENSNTNQGVQLKFLNFAFVITYLLYYYVFKILCLKWE